MLNVFLLHTFYHGAGVVVTYAYILAANLNFVKSIWSKKSKIEKKLIVSQ